MKANYYKSFFIFLTLSILACSAIAQPVYVMDNQTVVGCEGILLDSGNGTPTGNYDHNEDYIFTACLPGNGQITWMFLAMCLEAPYDYMTIYDGADTLAPLLVGPLTGSAPPQPFTTTGNCITIYFHSDANVACSGWTAQWSSEITTPTVPSMTLTNTNPNCNTTSLTVNFSAPIPCDSVTNGSFSVGGAVNQVVTNATPLNCLNGTTTSVQVNLSPGLTQSGYYVVNYASFVVDDCGNVWPVTASDTLAVTNCPMSVDLQAGDVFLCQGECTTLTAVPTGGNFLQYSYQWNPPIGNGAGGHQVCPAVTTTYSVTLSDGGTSAPVTDTITVFVLPVPQILPPNIPLCANGSPINLGAIPPGGTWSGTGITDANLGTFDPSVAGAGSYTITYTDPNGCNSTISLTVLPIDAGGTVAACPSAPPFQLTGGNPAGGTWSGPNVQPNGIFNPATAGTYTVTYTAPNGCSRNKTVNVANISLTSVPAVCESDAPFQLTYTPLGGNWTGTGITNGYWGWFSPATAADGLHILTYSIQGCSDTIQLFVKDINVPWGFTACPSEPAFVMSPPATPAGGTWTGIGIVNPVTGLFNPAQQGADYIDTLFYSVNGCMDTSFAYVWTTRINKDSMRFCLDAAPLALDWQNVSNTPWDGTWSGPGVTDPDFPGTFDPAVAGVGTHILYYSANTCTDSIVMIVRPVATPRDTAVCEFSTPFPLYTLFPGGIWAGPGITDPLLGIFAPQDVGVGTHTVFYLSPDSCLSSMEIDVYPLGPAIISGLQSNYCWKAAAVPLTANPPGGTFTGPGVVGNVFYPLLAGVGQHFISYSVGTGSCKQNGLAVTNVSPPLQLDATTSKDSICYGNYAQLTATATAGGSAAYSYTWNQNLGVGPNKAVSPFSYTTYTVIANDGCSEPDTASVSVYVHPQFSLSFSVTDTACFGEAGSATVNVTGNSIYTYSWHTSPPQTNQTVNVPSFYDYDVTVTDSLSGCNQSGNVVIPAYPYVKAAFLTNPTGECAIITVNPLFSLIDLSSGGTKGRWDLGDGTQITYQYGQPAPQHIYADTGHFTIKLYIENEAGCKDSSTAEVCIRHEPSVYYIPDVFTPNGDGVNDEWGIVSRGMNEYQLWIFDHWGRLVFESTDPYAKWDGKKAGIDLPEGVYTFRIYGKIYANSPRTGYRPAIFEEKGTVTLLR